MATIAVRVPTVDAGLSTLPGGHCYVLFEDVPHTVKDLITEKVRSEFRKLRASGDVAQTSLRDLLGVNQIGMSPMDEHLHLARAYRRFEEGAFVVEVDGRRVGRMGDLVRLTRRTSIMFVVMATMPVLVEA